MTASERKRCVHNMHWHISLEERVIRTHHPDVHSFMKSTKKTFIYVRFCVKGTIPYGITICVRLYNTSKAIYTARENLPSRNVCIRRVVKLFLYNETKLRSKQYIITTAKLSALFRIYIWVLSICVVVFDGICGVFRVRIML